MTDAHTKGPWTARQMHTGGFDIMDPRNRDVVTVYGGGVETESREANARLIAAAPDLLEAALLALTDLYNKADKDEEADQWSSVQALRAAILKATTPNAGERG